MARKIRNFINGKYVNAADGATTDVVNPATGKVYATAPKSGRADVDKAMKAAEVAFESWRDTTPSERSRALLKLGKMRRAKTCRAYQQTTCNPELEVGAVKTRRVGPKRYPRRLGCFAHHTNLPQFFGNEGSKPGGGNGENVVCRRSRGSSHGCSLSTGSADRGRTGPRCTPVCHPVSRAPRPDRRGRA